MSQAQMVRTKIRIDWFSSFREKEKVKRCVYKSVWLSKIKSTPLEKKLPYKLRLLYLFGNVLLKNIKKRFNLGGGSNFKKLISFLYKSKIHAAFIKVGTCRLVEDPLCHKDSQIRQYKVSQ